MLGGSIVLSSFFQLVESVLRSLPSYDFFIALMASMFVFGLFNLIKMIFME